MLQTPKKFNLPEKKIYRSEKKTNPSEKKIHPSEKKTNQLEYINDPTNLVLPKHESDIRVMTYNVHGFSDSFKNKKLNEILNVIREIDPDILALEEVFVYKRNEMITDSILKAKLHSIGLIYCAFSNNGVNAVFSKHPFAFSEIDLGRDHKYKIPRNALVCRFVSKQNDKLNGTVFVGTHLDVFNETGTLRSIQMNIILNKLETNKDDHKNKFIVVGDFNSLRRPDYNDEEWKHIEDVDKKRGVKTITDAVPIIEKNNFIDSFAYCNVPINVSVWSKRRVDYIYGKNIKFHKSAVYKKTFSDHYPIYADF
jgi:endonuclease/exonuclease/phosphatase family metal-dependent hydrolase